MLEIASNSLLRMEVSPIIRRSLPFGQYRSRTVSNLPPPCDLDLGKKTLTSRHHLLAGGLGNKEARLLHLFHWISSDEYMASTDSTSRPVD